MKEPNEEKTMEETLSRFLKGLDAIAFIKSTDSITGEVELMDPVISDQEAIIVIKGEFDREDLKELLHSENQRLLEAIEGEIGKMEMKIPTNDLRDVVMAMRDPKTLSKEDLQRQENRDASLRNKHVIVAAHNQALSDTLDIIRKYKNLSAKK